MTVLSDVWSRQQVSEAIARVPRVRLAALPTPLLPLPRLGQQLGVELWTKRDDMTELGLGGNKARILEYTVGKARDEGADVLVGVGWLQSNHTRQVAAAAIRVGMDAHLVLGVAGDEDIQIGGNYLLERLMGTPHDVVRASQESELAAAGDQVVRELKRQGRRPIIVTGDYPAVVGTIAYIGCALEALEQFDARAVPRPEVVVMSSTFSTQAGFVAAGRLLGIGWRIIGFAPIARPQARQTISSIAIRAARRLGMRIEAAASEVENDAAYVGRHYDDVTPASREAVLRIARLEAMFVDPIYGGRALAGLISYVSDGRIRPGSRVLFVHTGGHPLIFQRAAALLDEAGA